MTMLLTSASAFAQIPQPCSVPTNANADECTDACVLCTGINGYCSNSNGYTSGSDGGANFCPGSVVENNLYVGFISNITGNITFNIATSNCQGGPGLHGAIYDKCGTPGSPITCNSNLSGNQNWSMSYGNFTAGCVYYIMLEGLSSATDCNFCITTVPSNATVAPSPPAFTMITQTPNKGTICPGMTLTFSVPSSCNSKIYDWVVTGPGVIMTGENSNIITVLTTGVGTLKVCVRADNGCKKFPIDNSYICKDVIVKYPPTTSKTVFLCCEEDPYFENGNFYNPPCGGEDNDVLQYKTINNCDSMVNLKVVRRPDYLIDLGEIPLCKGEKVIVCGKEFNGNNPPDIYQVKCEVSPKDAKTFKCDTTKVFQLTHIIIVPKISPLSYTFPCPGSKVTLDGSGSTVEPFDPATTTIKYQWQEYLNVVGWTDINGATASKYTTDKPGQYRLRVSVDYKYIGQNGVSKVKKCEEYSSPATLSKSLVEPPLVPSFSIGKIYCNDTTYTFQVNQPDSSLVYKWTSSVKPKDTIIGLSASFKMTAPSTTICLIAFNSCNSPSPKKCEVIKVLLNPDAAIVVGLDSVCINTTMTYCIANFDSSATYVWTMPSGATFSKGPGLNCITVAFSNLAQSGNIAVNIKNECGENTTQYPITILPKPQNLIAITGDTVVCFNDTVSYTVDPNASSGYRWAISPVNSGAVIGNSSGGTVAIKWQKDGTLTAKAINQCGESNEVSKDVVVKKPPVAPNISGIQTICENGFADYAIDSLFPNVQYVWTVNGGNINSGQGTKFVNVQWGFPGAKSITVAATNECGTTTSTVFGVTVLAYPKPKLATNSQSCGLSSTLTAIPSLGSGVWKLKTAPIGGAANISSPTSAVSAVNVSICGNYTFVWTETNLICSDSATVDINFVEPPKATNLEEECNPLKTAYVVSFEVVGCAGPYKILDGVTNVVLQTLSSAPFLFVSAPVANNAVYQFLIEDATGCRSQVITGQRDCQCITDAGTVGTQLINVCEGGSVSVMANPDFVNDGNDTYQFVIHDKPGTKLGVVYGINKSGTFNFMPPLLTETTYYISRIAGNKGVTQDTVDRNDKCFQVSPGQPVIWRKYPIATAGQDLDTCGLGFQLFATIDLGSVSWKYLSGPGMINFNPIDAAFSNISATSSGIYGIEVTADNFGCITRDTVQVTFFPTDLTVVPNPTVAASYVCDSIGENYYLDFTLQKGTAPYSVEGQGFVGTTFKTSWYPNHAKDTLTFSDSRNCSVIPVPIGHNCPCLSKITSVGLVNSSLCQGDTAQCLAVGVKTDPNDIVEYVLSSSSNPVLNTSSIISRNLTGKFSLLPGMSCGTTYFVTALVGNINTTNPTQVEFGAECLASASIPLLFTCHPTAMAGTNDTICGNKYLLQGQNVGNLGVGSWKQLSGPSLSAFGSTSSAITTIDVFASGKYQFQWTLDNLGCKDSANVDLYFGAAPQVTETTTINDDKNGFLIDLKLSGGVPPYTVDNKAIAGISWQSDTIPCTIGQLVTLNFVVADAFGCMQTITVKETCNCKSDAGTINAQIPFFICENQISGKIPIPIDTVLDLKSTWEYVLNDNCGVKGGKILQKNKSGQFGFDPATMSFGKVYYITFIVGDSLKGGNGAVNLTDVCLDSTNCVGIEFINNPIVNAGTDDKICGNTYTLQGSSSVVDGSWSKIFGPGNANFEDPSNPKSTVTVDLCGTYSFEWIANNVDCVARDTVQITFSFSPTVTLKAENCNTTFTGYQVEFDVDACFLPITVAGMNGGVVANSTFVANLVGVDTANYSFTVKDANGCQQIISGFKDCKCKGTIAGNIITDLQNVCVDSLGNGFVNAIYTGYNLDANDTYHFVLTDVFTSGTIGTVLSQNKSGIFNFLPGMQFGKTYFIAAVIGDSLNNGYVKLGNNICLKVVGKPVVFTKIPTIIINAPAIVECVRNIQISGITDLGVGKWILKKVSKAGLTASFVPSSASLSPRIFVSDTGTYTFAWQVVNGICTMEKEFTIKFNRNPNQTIVNVDKLCNPNDTSYQVILTLNGLAPYNLLSGSMAGTFAGNIFTSNPIKSSLPYYYVIKDARSCDSVVSSGNQICPCKAFAGTPKPKLSICSGLDTVLNLNDFLSGEDVGGKWSVSPSTIGLTGNQFNTRFATVGDYKFYYLLPGKSVAPPCEGDTSSFDITINATPIASAGPDKIISCKRTIVDLGGNSTNDPSLSYLWTSLDGGSVATAILANTSTDKQGTYVLAIRNLATGCFDSDTVKVSAVTSTPIASLVVKDPLCYNEKNGKVILRISNGVTPYQFSFNGIKSVYTRKTDSLIFNFLPEGVYTLFIEDSIGCVFQTIVNLVSPPELYTTLGPDVTIDFGDSKKLIAQKNIDNEDIDTIIWRPMRLDSLSFWTDTLTVYPIENQKYCITLVTKNGCRAETCVRVSVAKKRPIYIPNVFRPDSESDKNSFFFINADPKFVEKIQNFEIFNRWGDVMYKLDNFDANIPELGWNGTFRGKEMDPGVYVYYAKILMKDGTVEIFKGDVTLVK